MIKLNTGLNWTVIIIIAAMLCTSISIAQKPCGNDIAPYPDSLIGISLGDRKCRFNAPELDTLLPELQDLDRFIEWIHQDGYSDCGTGFFRNGQYVEERRWNCPCSITSKIGNYGSANPGIVAIGGNEFYRYLPESIKPDKNKTYNAGYGDAAPAYCGCLRRVKVETEILYSGSGIINPVITATRPVSVMVKDTGFYQPIASKQIDPGFLDPPVSHPLTSEMTVPAKPYTVILKGSGSVIITYHADGGITLESKLKPRKTLIERIKSWVN